MNITSFDMNVRRYFVVFRSTRVYMKNCAQFSRLHTSPTRVSRRVPRVGEVWKGWPGCRVNASRKLLVDGLTRADKPNRVDSQPGLV